MSVVRKTVTFAANEVKVNVLTGLVEEFVQRPSAVRLFATQGTQGEVKIDFQLGNVSVGKDLEPGVKAIGTLNKNEDFLIGGVGAPGDRIQIRAVNTTAGTSDLTYMLEISELA